MSEFEAYLERKNAPMPPQHVEILEKGQAIPIASRLERNEINQLFEEGYLESENGFCRKEDGSTYVAVLTQMSNVSIDMIDWWFWWHAAESVRYQVWYPDMHYAVSSDFGGQYDDHSRSFSERLHLSKHLVTEDVGMGKEKILIDFMHPKDFGFDKAKLNPEKNTIISARVASPKNGVWATEMCHFVRKTVEGVEMRSRFWIGDNVYRMGGLGKKLFKTILNQPAVKSKLIPKEIGIKMFHHCSQEYHNLAEILPGLYAKYGSDKS